MSKYEMPQTEIIPVSDLSEDHDRFMPGCQPIRRPVDGHMRQKSVSHAKSFKEAYQEAKKVCVHQDAVHGVSAVWALFFFTAAPPLAVSIGEHLLIFVGVGYMLCGPRVCSEDAGRVT